MSQRVNATSKIRIDRVWSMPNKNTFEILPIKKLLAEEVDLQKYWIDPFANKNRIATVTNDLSMEYDTDYHLDALDFLKIFEECSVDGVLYDPPYSPRQVSECYNDVGYNVTWDTTKASFWGNHKREISRIVKIGGKVITFGWNSGGIGYKYGFEIERILMVPHGGWHNDTICTVEVKTHEGDYRKTPKKKHEKSDKVEETQMKTKEDNQLINKLVELPAGYWDFKDDDTKEFTHGIHNYPAMMVCPISRNIIKLVRDVQPITALLDPFAGSGTVLVEGMLSGIPTIAGNDINPLALLLIKVKSTPLKNEKLTKEANSVLEKIVSEIEKNKCAIDTVDSYVTDTLDLDIAEKKGWGDNAPKYLREFCKRENFTAEIPDFKNIGYWFKPRVILELAIVKAAIEEVQDSDIRDFFFIAMSETIRFVSNRRNGEFKMFRMPVAKVQTFNPNVYEEFKKTLLRNIDKMKDFTDFLQAEELNPDVLIYQNNACELSDIPNDKFDLIITSPPYGDSRTTVAYGEYSRLSLQWINLANLTEKEIMGVDKSLMGGRKYRNGFELKLESKTLRNALEIIKDIDIERAGDVYSFYEDLDASIRSSAKKTKRGGYHFWVVGNRTVKNVLLQTDVIISELAEQYELRTVYTIDRNIPNKVMPSLNSPSNVTGEKVTTMTTEHIVILRKL